MGQRISGLVLNKLVVYSVQDSRWQKTYCQFLLTAKYAERGLVVITSTQLCGRLGSDKLNITTNHLS